MKTLNRQKSEELFDEIRSIEFSVNHLGAYVQNPDFVNKDNAFQDYDSFDDEFSRVIKRLQDVRTELFKLYVDVLN